MKRAFRGPVEAATVDRYTAYALAKMKQELSFTESMKKVASGVLSSPMFLYRYPATDAKAYTLASNLSFFLWASGPDDKLLRLAASGELTKPEVLDKTIDRMLADPKIERFLGHVPRAVDAAREHPSCYARSQETPFVHARQKSPR